LHCILNVNASLVDLDERQSKLVATTLFDAGAGAAMDTVTNDVCEFGSCFATVAW